MRAVRWALLLCGLLVAPVQAITYFVNCTASNDDAACTSAGAPCETLLGAINKSNATNRTFQIAGNCTYRPSGVTVTNANGAAGAENVITWNGTGTPPKFTQSVAQTGWTQCASAGIGCGITDNRIYLASPGNPLWEWGLTIDGLREDAVNGQWDRQSFDASNGANCPSLTVLAFDKAWCQTGAGASAKLLLRSDSGDPDTRFGDIEVIKDTGAGNQQMLRLNHQHWRIAGSPTGNHLANNDGFELYLGIQILIDVREPHVHVSGVTLRDGTRPYGRPMRWYDDAGTTTLQDMVLSDFRIYRAGRDSLDLAGGANITSATLGGSLWVHHGEIAHNRDHAFMNPNLSTGGGVDDGDRTNILVEHVEEWGGCETMGFVSIKQPDNGSIPTMTFRHGHIHDMLEGNDPRIPPTQNLKEGNLTLGAECAASSAGSRGPTVNNNGNLTLEFMDISGVQDGVVMRKAGAGRITIRDSTITNNTRSGIVATANGGTLTVERSIVAFNGTGGISGSSFQIGCTGTFANAVFAGGATTATENYYWQGSGTTFARCATNLDMTGWRARTQGAADDASVHADPLFQDDVTDRNLQAGSPAENCNGTVDCGGYAVPALNECETVTATRWRCQATALYPVLADCTKLHPTVDGDTRTATNCVTESGNAGIQFTVGGSPTPTSAHTLQLDSDYGAVMQGPIFGLSLYGKRRNVQDKAVTNLIGGTDPAPVFASCVIPDTASDVTARITFTPNAVGLMLPATGGTGIGFDETSVAKTISGTCPRIGNNEFECTVTAAFSAGTTVRARYVQADGNITGGTAVEVAETAFSAATTCVNQVTAPPTAPTMLIATVNPDVVEVTVDPAGGTMVPATSCTGWTVSGHTVTACDRIDISQFGIPVTPAFVFGEATRQLCYTQAAGNVTNGTTELAESCIAITNQVPPPGGEGVLTQTHARISRANVPLDTYDAESTVPNGAEDATVPITAGATVRVRLQFTCTVDNCADASYVFQACDSSTCTFSNPADTNWYTLTNTFGARLTRLGQDTGLAPDVVPAQRLSACTLAGGSTLTASASGVTTFAMASGSCAEYLATVHIRAALATEDIRFRMAKGVTGVPFALYSVFGTLDGTLQNIGIR